MWVKVSSQWYSRINFIKSKLILRALRVSVVKSSFFSTIIKNTKIVTAN